MFCAGLELYSSNVYSHTTNGQRYPLVLTQCNCVRLGSTENDSLRASAFSCPVQTSEHIPEDKTAFVFVTCLGSGEANLQTVTST